MGAHGVPKHWREHVVTARVCLRDLPAVADNSFSTHHKVEMGDDDCSVPKLGTALIGFGVEGYVPIAYSTCAHNMAHACAIRHATAAFSAYEGPARAATWTFADDPDVPGYAIATWADIGGAPALDSEDGFERVIGTATLHRQLLASDLAAIAARDPWTGAPRWLPGLARWAAIALAIRSGDEAFPAPDPVLRAALTHAAFLDGRPAAYKVAYERLLEERHGKFFDPAVGLDASVKNESAWFRVHDGVIFGKPRALQVPRERHTRALGTTVFSKSLLAALPLRNDRVLAAKFHALHGADAYAQGHELKVAHAECQDGPEEPFELALDFVCYDGSCQQGAQALIYDRLKLAVCDDAAMQEGLDEEIAWREEGLLRGRTIVHGGRQPGQQPTMVTIYPASTESGGYLTSSGGTYLAAVALAYARARFIDAMPRARQELVVAQPFHYFGMGDDVKLTAHWLYEGFEKRLPVYLNELNFQVEIEDNPVLASGSLLSAFPMPYGSAPSGGQGPDDDWCLVPKIGKVLATSGWTVNACVPADDLAYAKYESLALMFGWVPILGALARAGLRCLAHVKPCKAARESVSAEYKRKYGTVVVPHTAHASIGTHEAMTRRYGLTAADIVSAEAYLRDCQLGFLDHHVLLRVVKHDMHALGESARMGGTVKFHGASLASVTEVAGK